jgi:predicted AlkP superfamily pyrophosphatase or phosphodiesterase
MRLPSLLALAIAAVLPAAAAPVLLISIDGLRPDYVTRADEHGLKIPSLRKFVLEGSYAEGVTGVVPTVTYPSHTTLVTGVAPAVHGIVSNTRFDPLGKNHGGWYWYGQEVRVRTLWEAASQAGITTASVNWPVTVAARGVRYLIPEYWRAATPDDLRLIEALSRPDGWLQGLEKRLGPFPNAAEGTIAGDETRTRYSIELLSTVKPGFMTVHLSSLDEAEHETAPFSPHSYETLEALDGMIGRLVAAALAAQPETTIAVVSDHGFIRTEHRVNLMVPFVAAGFVHLAQSGGAVVSWEAAPWPAGGSAAVMLKDASQTATGDAVGRMLQKLAASPENGIARVLDRREIQELGGYPDAAYLIEMQPGYQTGDATSGPMVTPAPSTGAHGYLPDRPEMRASFFVIGPQVAKGKRLGVIDMRQIAPTLAAVLGVPLSAATQPKLELGKT